MYILRFYIQVVIEKLILVTLVLAVKMYRSTPTEGSNQKLPQIYKVY
jgi:hypothetical protein